MEKEYLRQIEEFKSKIKELEEKLQMEVAVKKSEVIMNKNLNERIETQQIYIETLLKINENLSEKIGILNNRLKELVIKI
jgi:chaperonin cofactor prefoldin